jgi:hypothetical protein
MIWFLIKNYFILKRFMNIKINPFGLIKWKISYKIPYNKLNNKQRELDNKFCNKLSMIEFNNKKTNK